MSRTVALDLKTYQTLVDYAGKNGVSIGKAASELIQAGTTAKPPAAAPAGTAQPAQQPPAAAPPRAESPIRCPMCGKGMTFDYIGLGPGRYQILGMCTHCEVRR